MDKEVECFSWGTSGETKVNKRTFASYEGPTVTRKKETVCSGFLIRVRSEADYTALGEGPSVSLDEVSRSDILGCR